MKSKILLIGLIVAAIALSGCIQWPPICGNSFCEQGERWGESNYCPADCPPPSGAVEVTVKDYLGAVESATVQLRTADSELVDTLLSDEIGMAFFNGVAPGTYFVDVEKTGYAKFKSDNYDVKEGVTVKIEANLTAVSVGMATVVVGHGVVRIADGKQYPYDPTDTDVSNDYWTASLDFNRGANASPAVATLQKITVKNNVQKWHRNTNPLWSTDDSLTQKGRDAAAAGGNIAHFLQGESESTTGYDFVKMQFDGFENITDTNNVTVIEIGNNKVIYTDATNIVRNVPFYVRLANTSAQSTFTISGQTFYYRCSTTDVNVEIKSGNILNGTYIGIYSNQLRTDNGYIPLSSMRSGDKVNLGGVQFDVAQVNLTAGPSVTLIADGNCQFSKNSFSNPEYLKVGWYYTTLNNTMYYDDDNLNRPPITAPLNVTNNAMNDTYNYKMYVERASARDGAIYLLLDSSTYFDGEFFNSIRLLGTDTCETVYLDSCKTKKTYYWPDTADFGNSPGDTAFLTAHFNTGGNRDTNAFVYIDTATGNLITLPNDQLSSYACDVNFIETGLCLNMRTDAQQYYQAAWTDYGAKAELTDDRTTATFTIPQSQGYLSLTALGVGNQDGNQEIYSTEYSYTYSGADYALKSTDNASSVEFRKNIGSGQLPFLTNENKSYSYNGAAYDIVVKETVGIEIDARFDKDSAVKDLVAYIQATGDFNYVIDLSSGIPCWESTSDSTKKFTDGDSDNVMIPFLGSEYTVQEADCISATKKVTLVNESAKTNYSEGEWIEGLEGAGKYAGQEMDVKVGQLMQSSGTGAYSMAFELYDEAGMLVHRPDPIAEGTYLNETFVDSEGNYALKTIVYVDSIRLSIGGGGGGGS